MKREWTVGYSHGAPYGAKIAVFENHHDRLHLSVVQARALRDALTWALRRVARRARGRAALKLG